MIRKRLALMGAVAAVAATAALLGGVLRETAPQQAAAGGISSAAAAALQGDIPVRDTQALVRDLQAAVRAQPSDAGSLALLGLAYQQRGRETGDSTLYGKSETALRRALGLDPRNLTAVTGLGSLALAQHRFRDALALGRRARALSPSTAKTYGVIGDALLELGRYPEAFAAFDRMSALKPSLAAYTRIAYARELLGDTRGAEAAFRLAVDAATGQREPLAWTHVQLGKLYFGEGRLAPAARQYRFALAVLPGYVYALDALAYVEAARGRPDRAIALERQASNVIPLPQFVGALGDLYRADGRTREAREQYALVAAIDRLQRANGVRTDLEQTLFDVDHGIRLRDAAVRARVARAERPSIDGDDLLAWALVRTGRCAEALPYSQRALRLGTRDATKYFHRGMVERCLGHNEAARTWFSRAVALNPHFSPLWAPVARRLAR